MNLFAFDIETVPDVTGGRRLYGLEGLDDDQAAEAMLALRRQASGGSDFLRLHLHRVAVISVAARIGERFTVFSLGDDGDDEGELLQRFFDGLERYVPRLVSWNGSGFDLPVLHYRAMIHGVSAPKYWDTGDGDREFRFNNYLNRFHDRHTDLMDVLAGYQSRANAPLDEIASLCGLPGKLGMSGDQVRARIAAGDFAAVRDYCETDVLNTYLLWLRFEQMRGHLDREGHAAECERVRNALAEAGRPHLDAFLQAWQG
ncbi:3'-5' exonuclease [Sediminicurvatus halobius]|uniref:3'-5' exonuclease n=1 Tax=Sediminicurvatus halobius TaxID=2182432 RepID=A0A2U2N8T2_9GAMM|nr:3'-5' exonuclease [Spiribacter halobius]PWG65503.1 3'-5' exonuclease [Spiribacter halobius]UEX76527.1 3'-5' exonuclease [Spiribacter halobius]